MPKKIELYTDQRLSIINKLFEILEINDTNRIFSLHKLDNDYIKQENILALEPDIKKYFNCSRWACIHRKNMDRRWLSFIKYVFKDLNITYSTSRIVGDCINYENYGTFYNVNL